MKEFHAAHIFAEAISEATNIVSERVIARYKDRGTIGREEDISSQLVGELTDHLIEEISKNVKGIAVDDIKFDAVIYKKKTEKTVGADIAGSIAYEGFGADQVKVFLAQAKVAASAEKTDIHKIKIKVTDDRLLGQCKKMLDITPASFVFVYSEHGVHVIPASEIVVSGKSSVDTERSHYKELGSFYEEVYKCFIGDLSLGDSYRDESKMKKICEKLKAKRALAMKVSKKANKKAP